MINNSTDDLILEKLVILYTLNNTDDGITDSQLIQIILGTDVMNYFTLLTLLPKMIESKFITTYTKNDTTLYAITQNGLEVLVYFQNRIPDYFKNTIDEYIIDNGEDLFSSQIKRQSNYSLQGDTTYVVTLIIVKGRKNIMTLNLNVDTEEDAKDLCEKWNEGYMEKYTMIKEILGI
ncbi:DUF4364 family protein [Peptostreptococcus faecalis]|uniref:DUF4364 family protein n=1 Tax=Peptostreptococcus faecalis TaxID=2045015 RepID=UPI000C7A3D02|nr:DUF4364 family protein [Peptostreptococcus faecalis]